MERTKTLWAVLFLVAAVGLLFTSVRQTKIADVDGSDLIAAADSKPGPDFTLTDAATGKPVRLSDVTRAQPVLLDFWATWCGPCREELPALETLSHRYAGRVAFYGVNASDPPQNIVKFAQANHLTFPMLSDRGGRATLAYGADAIPLVVVLDRQGRARCVRQGVRSGEDVKASLSAVLDQLLAERA